MTMKNVQEKVREPQGSFYLWNVVKIYDNNYKEKIENWEKW